MRAFGYSSSLTFFVHRGLTYASQPDMKAIARAPSLPHSMNKLEGAYADRLGLYRHAGEIQGYRFEPIKLRLGGDWKTTYTPDFQVIAKDGTIEFHEVKGFMREDAAVKLKVAAAEYPEFRFLLATRVKGAWKVEEF